MSVVLGAIGYGGHAMYGAVRAKQIAAEKAEQDRIAAREAARQAELMRIEDEKRAAIRSADRETLRKVVMSCREQISSTLSKGVFAINLPYYSPTDLEKFADIGAAFGKALGWPSVALDNYDFNDVDWNLDCIKSEYPIYSASFVVDGSQDGFSVKHYAAVWTCDLDGLKAKEPERSKIYYLD